MKGSGKVFENQIFQKKNGLYQYIYRSSQIPKNQQDKGEILYFNI